MEPLFSDPELTYDMTTQTFNMALTTQLKIHEKKYLE
jgi:hypothetical protein